MKDESARDKAIENLVSDKLRARSTPGNGCPDAEIIAAYFERSLAPKERARWEAHFDTCAQCQHRIAALVRMDEAGEASMTHPSANPLAQPAKTINVPERGWAFGRWAWAAPVLLVVLVAGLWYTGEFDSFIDRHTGTEQRASVPSQPQTQPQPATAETPQKKTSAENRVAGLQAGSAKTSPASSAMTAKDQTKPRQSAPSASAMVGQNAQAQAPPPPPAKTNLENEQQDRQLETASAAPPTEGGPRQVQTMPVAGRNVAGISAESQMQEAGSGQGTGQGVGSTAVADAMSENRIRAAPKTEPEASTVAGAAGEVQAKAENAPAPAPPPPAMTTAEVGSPSAPRPLNSTSGSSAQLLKEAEKPAQTSAGTVMGIVRDPTGAAIPGATVVVTNTRTNVAKPFTTNAAGEYVAAGLNPGVYTVEASKQGFTSSSKKDVPLLARADRQVDLSLEVGAATQTVTGEPALRFMRPVAPQWRVGPHGLIERRSGQGGWETKPSGVGVDLYAISFASQQVGWAVGQGGTVLRSANGGESWGRVAGPTAEDLVRVRARSAESAEVATRSGVIFRTTDGAATWTRIETNP